jgi:hypothetical protein
MPKTLRPVSLFDDAKPLDVPRVHHQRLLADRLRPDPQGEPDVGIVKIVGRRHADEVELRPLALHQLDVAVEALELGEEARIREKAVEDSHRVAVVERRDEIVAGLLDRLHVARRDIACGADQREILHSGAPSGPLAGF